MVRVEQTMSSTSSNSNAPPKKAVKKDDDSKSKREHKVKTHKKEKKHKKDRKDKKHKKRKEGMGSDPSVGVGWLRLYRGLAQWRIPCIQEIFRTSRRRLTKRFLASSAHGGGKSEGA